jgi:3-hydroxyacyl-CoA dehydrogenase/enoyl-CoA hydratase/3-hydroxybutyryl-CoA epimerase
VPQPVLLEAARRAAVKLADGSLVPRRRGIPLSERLLRPVIFSKARSTVREKTQGHYPAPLAAIDVVEKGTATSLEEGLKLEAKAFGELSVSPVSRALVSVFFATQEIKKDAGYPESTEARQVHKLGVVGAGLMGAGIADALGRGLRYAREVFEERLKRRSLTRYEFAARLNRISATQDYSGFKRADLVIEAVFEDLALKRKVLAEVEAATREDCVVASNTSSLPIGDIAKESRRPSRVLGMHFFSPVNKMPLLEVIVTPQTDAWATATAVQVGRSMGKHVIVVRDGPGFYTSRALAPYMNEAARLVEEGAPIEDVDRAMVAFGFPVGPITLLDEVGIDVGAKVSKILYHAFGERMAPPESMARVVDAVRLGRKNKRGFYLYDEDGKRKGVDESVYALLPGGGARKPIEMREIQERCVFAFLNEAALCLQEGILRSPRDGDVGAIFGLGFPAFLGGPFRYLDHLGARFAVEVLERLRAKHGERFKPADLLVQYAREGRTFY